MQYKTIQIEHYVLVKRKESFKLNQQYERVINAEAASGWKLLGIHSLPIKRRTGCLQMLCLNFFEVVHMDILIFFKD